MNGPVSSAERASSGFPSGAERGGKVQGVVNHATTVVKNLPGIERAAQWWRTAKSIARDPGEYMSTFLGVTTEATQHTQQGDTATQAVLKQEAQAEADRTDTIQEYPFQGEDGSSTTRLVLPQDPTRPQAPDPTTLPEVKNDIQEHAYQLLQKDPKTQVFFKNMEHQSLFTRWWKLQHQDEAANIDFKTREGNMIVVTKLIGENFLQNASSGQQIMQEVLRKISELKVNRGNLQSLFGEPTDETVFALRRLESALRHGDSTTRKTARDLHVLRKQSNLTIPKFALANSGDVVRSLVDKFQRDQLFGVVNSFGKAVVQGQVV